MPHPPSPAALTAIAAGLAAADPPAPGHNGGPPLDEAALSMTVKTACAVSGFGKDLIYELLRAGEIKSFLIGSRRYIVTQSLRDYVERKTAETFVGVGPQRPNRRRNGRQVGPAR